MTTRIHGHKPDSQALCLDTRSRSIYKNREQAIDQPRLPLPRARR